VRQDPLRGFGLVADSRARVLILGSFPGQASLQAGHYYAHPRNQFWPILSEILELPLTELDFEARYSRLHEHRIALWDVLSACHRIGSLDSRIRHPLANDFQVLTCRTPSLQKIIFNGKTAARTARQFEERGFQTQTVPSTSPAYAAMPYAQKLQAWKAAFKES
jgi:hypoxanthine-DNA glycosylase